MAGLHPQDAGTRRRVAATLATGIQHRIEPASGYVLVQLADHPVMQRVLSHCDALKSQESFRAEAARSKKAFLQTMEFDLHDRQHESIFDLACDPAVLGPVAEYLGTIPVLHRAGLSYSPNAATQALRGSQKYHLDREDDRQIKIHIYLQDVGEENSPMTVLSAEESARVYDTLRKKGVMTHRLSFLDDREVYGVSALREGTVLAGPRGTVAFVDTCNCYHYGSRPNSGDRLVLYFHFASAFSIEMPAWRRRPESIPERDGLDPRQREIRQLVLGLYNSHRARA